MGRTRLGAPCRVGSSTLHTASGGRMGVPMQPTALVAGVVRRPDRQSSLLCPSGAWSI